MKAEVISLGTSNSVAHTDVTFACVVETLDLNACVVVPCGELTDPWTGAQADWGLPDCCESHSGRRTGAPVSWDLTAAMAASVQARPSFAVTAGCRPSRMLAKNSSNSALNPQ